MQKKLFVLYTSSMISVQQYQIPVAAMSSVSFFHHLS